MGASTIDLFTCLRAKLPAQLTDDALQDPAGRYLIEDYELSYAPAISVLAYTGRRQDAVAANAKGPWAIVGNPAVLPMMGDRALPAVPGAATTRSVVPLPL